MPNGVNVSHHAKVPTCHPTIRVHSWAHRWDRHSPHSSRQARSARRAALTAGPATNHHTNWVRISMSYRQRPAHTARSPANMALMCTIINCFHCVSTLSMAARRGHRAPKSMMAAKPSPITTQRPSMKNTICRVPKGKTFDINPFASKLWMNFSWSDDVWDWNGP